MFTSTVLLGLAVIACTYGNTVDQKLVDDLSANITASINKDLESAKQGDKNTLKTVVKNVKPLLGHLADLTSPQEATDIVIRRLANSNNSNGLATRMGSNRRRHLAALIRKAVMGAQRFRY
uniref:Uncharacterized protein n=1 Tax=Cuerna arida TaxID=1464854 RepID=A0A1B6GEJ7_9HEMI